MVFRHNSDDSARMLIEGNALPYQICRRSQFVLPKCMRKHGCAAFAEILLFKCATNCLRNSEHRKKVNACGNH